MIIRYFALVYGIVFLLVGVAGFIPAFLSPYPEAESTLALDAWSGYLFGLFPVNVLHNLVHIVFGIWGIVAWKGLRPARTYAQTVAVVYAVFFVMGFLPVLNTTFGLVPLHGGDIWLHLVLAAVAAYFGFMAKPDNAAPPTGEPGNTN